MKKLVFAMVLIILLLSAVCSAGDAELYGLINGKIYTISANDTVFDLVFQGSDAENYSGAAWLYWNESVIIDGYRYPIRKKLLMSFMVWNGLIDIDVADAGNVSTFSFVPDWQGVLTQVCPDLRFFPETEE